MSLSREARPAAAVQVHGPLGQAAGSRSIWRKNRAQVLNSFLGLRLRRVGREARIMAAPRVSVCTPKFQVRVLQQREPRRRRKAEREGTQLGPVCSPTGRPPRRALSPRPLRPRPTNNAPARPRAPHSPPRSAPRRRPRGRTWPWQRLPCRPGAARAPGPPGPPLAPTAARRTPSRAPSRARAAEEAAPPAALKLERGARA